MKKIANKLYHISKEEIARIIKEATKNNYHLIILDGKEIHTEDNYVKKMSKVYDFPTDGYKWEEIRWNYDGYFDWIRDLSWLLDQGYQGFVLIIDNYADFLAKDAEFKEYLNIRGFPGIFDWWSRDVEKYTNYQTKKSFNIYLVDK